MDKKQEGEKKSTSQQATHQILWQDTSPEQTRGPSTGQTHSRTAFWWTYREAPVHSCHSLCWRNTSLPSDL